MTKFTYIEHDKNSDKEIFTFIGKDILDADKAFKEKISKDVTKLPNVGCALSKHDNPL